MRSRGSLRARSTMIAVLAAGAALAAVAQTDKQLPRRGTVQFGASQAPVAWSTREIGAFRDVFVKVSRSVVPAVVSIIPTIVDSSSPATPADRPFGGEPSSLAPKAPESPPWGRGPRRFEELGTGFIVSPDGYILTNNHVVAGAQKIDVQLNDGRTFKAVVVGADSLSDVAVIRIVGAAVKNLPVVYLGNSDEINVGDWVAAVGNPFSLTSSVTSGIVSAVGRKIDDAASLYQNFIQTDAAINPGNSGGPLVDIQGAVIGINTLIFSKTGGFMGIGFAIPVNLARRVMEDLVYRGEVVRGWIGITVQRLERTARGGPARGAVVADVSSGQPAALAGIRRGDVIMSIGGKEVKGPNDVLTIVAELQPGQQVPVALLRDGKQLTTTLTVAARPPQSAPVK